MRNSPPLPRARRGTRLTADAWNSLVERVDALEGLTIAENCGLTLRKTPGGPIIGYVAPRQALIAKTPSGGIPAMSGTTLGSATCRIWNIGASGVLADSLVDITVYNMVGGSTAAGVGGKYIQVKRIDGKWVVDVDQCS